MFSTLFWALLNLQRQASLHIQWGTVCLARFNTLGCSAFHFHPDIPQTENRQFQIHNQTSPLHIFSINNVTLCCRCVLSGCFWVCWWVSFFSLSCFEWFCRIIRLPPPFSSVILLHVQYSFDFYPFRMNLGLLFFVYMSGFWSVYNVSFYACSSLLQYKGELCPDKLDVSHSKFMWIWPVGKFWTLTQCEEMLIVDCPCIQFKTVVWVTY